MSSEDFSIFISSFDIRNPIRIEWQNVVRSDERERLQLALIYMATDSFHGTEQDQLGIYKAAHSVLPLKGRELRQLANLLSKYTDDIADWLDVFVEALAQSDTANPELTGQVGKALYDYMIAAGESILEDKKFISACFHIYRLGYYQPNWMLALLQSTHKEI